MSYYCSNCKTWYLLESDNYRDQVEEVSEHRCGEGRVIQ